MTAAADDTLQALLSAAAAIWPAPARVSTQQQSPDDLDRSDSSDPSDGSLPSGSSDPSDGPGRQRLADLVVVPSLRHPKLVLPANAPRAAAEALTRVSDDASGRTRFVRAAASRVLRLPGVAGLLRHPRLMGSDDRRPNRLTVTAPAGVEVRSLQRRLSELLDTEVLLGFGVGSPRANRKPVVQVFRPDGRTVAWAKLGTAVGTDTVARDLVRGEAEALRTFWSADRTLEHLMAPRVLHAGPWGDTEVLVLSPLRPGTGRDAPVSTGAWLRRRRADLLREAMAELATRFDVEVRSLADTEFWRKIRKVPELADATAAAEAMYGERMVTLGAWHGDWTPWNMRTDTDRVLLWDFERFTRGVPVGLDAAHYRLQSALRSGGEGAAERLLIDGPLVDEPGGELLTTVYLLELARRWIRASEPEVGAPLRRRTTWLLRLLDAWMDGGSPTR